MTLLHFTVCAMAIFNCALCYWVWCLEKEINSERQINRNIQGGLDTRIQLSISEIGQKIKEHKAMENAIESANRKAQTSYDLVNNLILSSAKMNRTVTHNHTHKHIHKTRRLKPLLPKTDSKKLELESAVQSKTMNDYKGSPWV